MKKNLALLGLLFVFGACAEIESPVENPNPDYFFDLKEYINQYAASAKAKDMTLTKEVDKNGEKRSTVQLDSLDWEKELGLIRESDINKPAWKEKYEKSTVGDTLIYRCTDPELTVRELKVLKNESGVHYISIQRHTTNVLYTAHQEIQFYPDSLYAVQAHQVIKVLGENKFTTRLIME